MFAIVSTIIKNISQLKFKAYFQYGLLVILSACNDIQDNSAIESIKTNESDTEIYSSKQPTGMYYNVAFLIMDGVYNTELTAPFDIFHHTVFRENIKPMRVFTVAEFSRPITTFEGLKLLPDYSFVKDSLPVIDILVVPSAEHHLDTDLENENLVSFVKKTAENAQWVTSHCDGAFLLAEAGLLNGKVATTFPSDVEAMQQRYPEVEVREGILFVHDGKYITSAGGAKSFEAALYLSEYLYGAEIAKSLAKGLVIDWNLEEVPHIVVED